MHIKDLEGKDNGIYNRSMWNLKWIPELINEKGMNVKGQ
jgi:hypothetical protein